MLLGDTPCLFTSAMFSFYLLDFYLGEEKKNQAPFPSLPILPLSPEQDSTLVGSLSAYNYSYCRSFLLINSGLFGMDKNHIQSVFSSRFCKAKSLLSLTVGSVQLEFHSKR